MQTRSAIWDFLDNLVRNLAMILIVALSMPW